MTMTMELQDRSARWWLIGSLALNLLFVGTIGTLAVRHMLAPPQQAATERPRTAAGRIERLAAPLPAADGEKLRAAFRVREAAAESGREGVNRAFERIQAALRAEPFDAAQLRAAFAEARGVRPAYEQAMQEIIASAAAEMSREGRVKLFDAPPQRPNTTR